MESKTCRDCGESKPLTEFSPSSKNRDGRVSYCRPCLAVRHLRYRDARAGAEPSRRSRARATSADVKWCPRCELEVPRAEFGRNRSASDGLTAYCRPCHNDKSRENRLRHHGSSRNFWLKRRYGITAEQYDALAAEQGGVCALCRRRPPQHVDHDHLTGQVRGLLCSGCNQGLGNFRDDAAVLRLAADYVSQHSWQKVLVEPGVYRMVPPQGAAPESAPSA